MRTSGAAGIALLVIGCVLTGCAGGGGGGGGTAAGPACKPPAGGATVSLASNIQPIFDRSCALPACHVPPVPGGALDLTRGRARPQLVNVKSTQVALRRVKPGDPDDSYLVRKIEGGPNIAGLPMPQNCPTQQPCLTPDEMQAIRQWITECAPNN
ncbi:MAG TPA: hypothetical protein VKA21_05765 [Candidatus Binatia bacterium]|nr:hypothetical protein [Candidatus Binatia bacterium]